MPTCPMCNADADDMDSHKNDVHPEETPAGTDEKMKDSAEEPQA